MDPGTMERADRLRQMMNELILTMPSWQRDRLMQAHLSQSRGPSGNASALRVLMNHFIQMRQSRKQQEEPDER